MKMLAGPVLLAASMLGTLVACGSPGTDGPTAPINAPKSTAATIVAVSPTQQSGLAGAPVWVSPVFQVMDANGNAVANVTVACTVTAGAGSASPAGLTDSFGFGFCPKWILGTTPGVNSLVVTIPGLTPVQFTASAHDVSYFENYAMLTYDGRLLPYTDPNSGSQVQSGRFLLSPDGTFNNTEVWSAFPVSIAGTYMRSGNDLIFYEHLYGNIGFPGPKLFATGLIVSDSLEIAVDDEYSEDYVKIK